MGGSEGRKLLPVQCSVAWEWGTWEVICVFGVTCASLPVAGPATVAAHRYLAPQIRYLLLTPCWMLSSCPTLTSFHVWTPTRVSCSPCGAEEPHVKRANATLSPEPAANFCGLAETCTAVASLFAVRP